MHHELHRLKEKYDKAPWDELHTKGLHRDMTMLASQGFNFDSVGLGAKFRLAPNILSWRELSPKDAARAVARLQKRMSLCIIHKRIYKDAMFGIVRRLSFTNWLYRMGNMSRTDYKHYNEYVRSPKNLGVRNGLNDMETMKNVFFSKMRQAVTWRQCLQKFYVWRMRLLAVMVQLPTKVFVFDFAFLYSMFIR